MKLKATGGHAGDHGRRREDAESQGRQREATRSHGSPPGGHRGQLPRTDFGQEHRIEFSINAAKTPKATLV